MVLLDPLRLARLGAPGLLRSAGASVRTLTCAIALASAVGCAYPRRSMELLPASSSNVDRATQPEDLWHLTLVRAEVPPEKRSGLSWDDDNGKPDPYFVLLIDGKKRWQSPALEDTAQPEFNATPTDNLAFKRDQRVRMELWDKDGLGSDPIGIYEGKALGDAILGIDTTVKLDSGATVTLRIAKPEPKLGVGITAYEVRPSSLVVLAVMPNSPASRADIREGDRITAIGGRPVEKMDPAEAESALTLGAEQHSELTVQRGKATRKVQLDSPYVWGSI